MKVSGARRSDRHGFTLVELLIVIAIISVLVSLISSAVWKAVVTANRVRNQNEISQMATAVENFKQKFGIYPPSRIFLAESLTDYGDLRKPGLASDSYAFLTTIFPRLVLPDKKDGKSFIDWDGNGAYSPPAILEGDQCLVFFLGGIPQFDQNGRAFCSGFSTNPADPTWHLRKGGDTIPLFFEFDSTRLFQHKPPSRFLSYRDTYGNRGMGTPYAYFSSYKTRNGYNRYLPPTFNIPVSSDCQSLNVWPYAEGPISSSVSPPLLSQPSNWRYLNPNTFQIISAGPDGVFGQGTNPSPRFQNSPTPFWSPDRAGNTEANRGNADLPPPTLPKAGLDDQSNFYDSTLGTGS